MKKKGFTLVELLAVIVILAIIALIAIPLIGNVIEKAKIGALESSVNGLVESANMYYANETIKGSTVTETTFDWADGVQTTTEKLEYKGKVENGKLILHANGEVAVCVDDTEHYAYKNKDSDEIVSGNGTCLYDGTTGDFSSNTESSGVYYLGTGTTFNLTTLLPNVDYTTLTEDNFIVVVSSISITGGGNPGVRDDLKWTNSVTQISKKYDASTGVLTVSGGSGTSKCYSNSNASYSATSTMSTTKDVYLVIGTIK